MASADADGFKLALGDQLSQFGLADRQHLSGFGLRTKDRLHCLCLRHGQRGVAGALAGMNNQLVPANSGGYSESLAGGLIPSFFSKNFAVSRGYSFASPDLKAASTYARSILSALAC